MTEIIEKLQLINEQKQQLEQQEAILMSVIKDGKYEAKDVFNEFLKIKSINTITRQEDKKMFVFVCLSICSPEFRLGKRLPFRHRQIIASVINIHPTKISHIVKDVMIYYRIYKPFKIEADYLYNTIKRSLT